MALTPVEIRHLRLGRSFLGYSKDEADRLFVEIADSFEDVWRDRADLTDKIEKLEVDLVRYKETESLLRSTLLSAEKNAAEQRDQARREAEQIIRGAHAEARQVTNGALSELERLQAEARRIRGLLQSALMVVEPAVVEAVEPEDRWPEEDTGEVAAGAA